MSIPITKAMAKTKRTPTPCAAEDKKSEEAELPAIDILSLCTQTEQHYRHERQHTKEKRLTRIHNNNHIFKSSNYGIDGSFPPRVSSWSHRTRNTRGVQGYPHSGSRCKSEMSFTHDDIIQLQSPKSGFSSPCFQRRSPPIRCRLQSYPPSMRNMGFCEGPDAQDFIVSRANLNKRPKKRHLSFKTDSQGNVSNVYGSDFRKTSASRQFSDSQLTSFPAKNSSACDESSLSQSKVLYFGRNVWLPDADYDVSNLVITPKETSNTVSNSDQTLNDILVEAAAPLNTIVKKIDIKLPCLEK